MTDRTTELHDAQVIHTRRIAGRVLTTLAMALGGAAVALLVLMAGQWMWTGMRDSGQAHHDFPGRYLFAVVPMLIATLILAGEGRDMRR